MSFEDSHPRIHPAPVLPLFAGLMGNDVKVQDLKWETRALLRTRVGVPGSGLEAGLEALIAHSCE
jgi:hypothetical protein